jgi:phosphoribosylformylglycinamidine synthase I
MGALHAAPPTAIVLVFPGSNGERDLYEALQLAGFAPRYLPASEALPDDVADDVALVGLPGGFSYGDYWRAGMLASRARAVRSLPRIIARGGLVIGICNGFQILVEAGLLPGALTYNSPPRFVHRYIEVTVTAAARGNPWFSELGEGDTLRLPIAHAEGNYYHPAGAPFLAPRVPLVYRENPNGSMADAAAVLDDSGRVLGLMPHPERACESVLGSQDGLAIFRAAHRYVSRAKQEAA